MVTIVPFLPPYISWKHFTLKSLLCVIYPFILTTNLGPSKQFTRKDRGVQSSEVQEDNPSSNDEDVSQGLKPKQLFKSAGWCAASLPASFLSQKKYPGWIWSRGTHISGANKQNKGGRCA